MSFNRENVVWQSADGTWNRAFFRVLWTGEDPEWDVEYGQDFGWVSRGHSTEQQAIDSWQGANPGGWSGCSLEQSPTNCEYFDRLAEEAAAKK